MRKRALFILIALLLVMPLVIHAEGDPHENACYEGGSMWRDNGDGCPTEWHWIVGWYLANWENNGGWSNPDNSFPDWADPEHVLPPDPAAAPVVENPPSNGGNNGGGDNNNSNHQSAACIRFGLRYVNFNNGWMLSRPVTMYADSACSLSVTTVPLNLVYVPRLSDGNALCEEAFPGTQGEAREEDVYECITG